MFLKSISLLIVCALVRISSGLDIPERYLNMPLSERDMEGGNFDRYLIKALKLSAGSSPDSVLAQLNEIASTDKLIDGTFSYEDFLRAKHLKALADSSKSCSLNSVNEFLANYQIYKYTDPSNHPEVMLKYLEHFGRIRYSACGPETIERVRTSLKMFHEDFEQAEKFFRLAVSMIDASDEKFLETLKQFEPLKSSIDVAKLAPISERTRSKLLAADRIKRKFNKMCLSVFRIADFDMETLNLANFFAPNEKYFEKDLDLGKLNEMNRICNDAYKREAFLDHLRELSKPEHDSLYPDE